MIFVRIDDRLIHGQVVTAWVKHLDISKIIIVDDDVYKDDFLKKVLYMVSPPGIKLEIFSTVMFQNVNQTEKKDEHTMILIKTPQVAKFIYDKVIKFKELNIGGMGAKPGRKVLYRNVSISPEELEILKELVEEGVKVYYQAVPSDKPIDIHEIDLYKKMINRKG